MRDYEVLLNALNAMSNKSSCYYCQGETLVCEAHGCILSNAADAIEELLDELTTIRKQLPCWISVENELPSRYETVLLNIQTCKDSYVTIGDYEPNELRFRDFADRNNQVYCGDIVTHWMPLPEPPKGVE